MPIRRSMTVDVDYYARMIQMATESVRKHEHPLYDSGWKSLIAQTLGIDHESATHLFEELVGRRVLLFTRVKGNKPIYITDRTPEHRKYVYSGDISYGSKQ